MPCLVLLVGALFLKAFSTWIQHSSDNKSDDSSSAQATVLHIILNALYKLIIVKKMLFL